MHLSTWTSFKWRGNQARGFFFFLHFILFYFLTLQYCIGFEIYQHESATGIHVLPIPLGRPSAPAPSIQYCASNLDWRLISYMILYMLNVQFIRFDWTDCLWPNGLQHTRLPCPLPTPRTRWNSCPSIQWCHPTIRSSVIFLLLPSVFPRISIFSNDSVLLIRWPKYQLLSFSISHPNEYSRMSSFRIDRFDLLIVLPFLSYVIGTDRFWRKLWFCWRCSILESTS